MTQSQRKFFGTFLIIGSLIVWAILAVWLFEALGLVDNAILTLLYFVVVGVAWCLPAMAIIRWMARPDRHA